MCVGELVLQQMPVDAASLLVPGKLKEKLQITVREPLFYDGTGLSHTQRGYSVVKLVH